MRLLKLIQALDTLEINFPSLDSEVEGVHNDTRKMKPGDMFVAIPGALRDGYDYIPEALRRGASLVVSERPLGEDVPHVIVPDAKVALAQLAACMHNYPANALTMIGITGTKGKSTTAELVKAILDGEAGVRTGLIGTNYILIGDEIRSVERNTPTTPDAVQLHGILRDMAEAGCTHCVMEVSSHALHQSRVLGIPYKVGCFTNLQHDHLDYHHGMEDYFECKALLFRQSEHAAVHLGDPWGRKLAERLSGACFGFGGDSADARLRAEDIELLPDSVRFTAVEGADRAVVCWHTPGMFSVQNALAALACARLTGIPLDRAARRLESAKPVVARMERLEVPAAFTVISDYAHTPAALENVLSTARGFTKGRVLTVFGCGGDRDRLKRPMMGEVAARLSDVCFITSDNPRSEKTEDIIAEILSGTTGNPVVIPERREAIYAALREAAEGDTVMLCGKGQETYQEIQGVKHPMDEKEIVRGFFAKR